VAASPAARQLSASATDQHVTLTLIGYKGGPLDSQINQDRALVVAPYSIVKDDASDDTENHPPNTNSTPEIEAFWKLDRTLVGAFDGHAPLGEKVSEYTVTELPKRLAHKLHSKAAASNPKLSEVELTKAALTETFIELDATAPADPSGGCTATVVLQQGHHIYLANAGDSRSFVVAYRPSTNHTAVVAITREDKPDLPDERARVEAAGGQVYIPARGTSRVVYHDATTGAPTGLAMSRSIGDWCVFVICELKVVVCVCVCVCVCGRRLQRSAIADSLSLGTHLFVWKSGRRARWA